MNKEHEEFKINIRPDRDMSIGKFKPNFQTPGEYYAHPDTIKALKKDIFVRDHAEVDVIDDYACEGCKKVIDRKFWLYCPYCGTTFPEV